MVVKSAVLYWPNTLINGNETIQSFKSFLCSLSSSLLPPEVSSLLACLTSSHCTLHFSLSLRLKPHFLPCFLPPPVSLSAKRRINTVCLLETSLFTPSLTVWSEALKLNHVYFHLPAPVHLCHSYYVYSLCLVALIINQTTSLFRPIFILLRPPITAHVRVVLFIAPHMTPAVSFNPSVCFMWAT